MESPRLVAKHRARVVRVALATPRVKGQQQVIRNVGVTPPQLSNYVLHVRRILAREQGECSRKCGETRMLPIQMLIWRKESRPHGIEFRRLVPGQSGVRDFEHNG